MSSRYLAAGLAALLLAVPVFANGAPFPRPPVNMTSAEAKLVVLVDANARKAVLRVPANLIAGKKEEPRPRGQALLGDPSTALAGLALFGAFVSGGFWLVRGKNKRTAAILCVACLALAGSAAFADLLPPRPPVLPPLVLPGKMQLAGDITIVTTNSPGNVIELVVPGEKPAPIKPGELPPPPRPE